LGLTVFNYVLQTFQFGKFVNFSFFHDWQPYGRDPFRGHASPKSTMKLASPYDLENTCPSKILSEIGGLFAS